MSDPTQTLTYGCGHTRPKPNPTLLHLSAEMVRVYNCPACFAETNRLRANMRPELIEELLAARAQAESAAHRHGFTPPQHAADPGALYYGPAFRPETPTLRPVLLKYPEAPAVSERRRIEARILAPFAPWLWPVGYSITRNARELMKSEILSMSKRERHGFLSQLQSLLSLEVRGQLRRQQTRNKAKRNR